jgi:hypothetical protein
MYHSSATLSRLGLLRAVPDLQNDLNMEGVSVTPSNGHVIATPGYRGEPLPDPNGDEVLARPRFEDAEFEVDPDLVFVLMPFDSSFDAVFKEGIEKVVEKQLGLRCQRADEITAPHPVMGDVWERINCAGILVADITGANANVAYEIGIAHAIHRDVILIKQGDGRVPFDLQDIRYIPYDTSDEGLAGLREKLGAAIHGLRTGEYGTMHAGLAHAKDVLKRAQMLWERNRFIWPPFDVFQEVNLYGDELLGALDRPAMAFMLRVALHYGIDFVYWVQRNGSNQSAVPVLIETLVGTERRPIFRAGFALEHVSPDLRDRIFVEVRRRHGSDVRVSTVLDAAEQGRTLDLWNDPPSGLFEEGHAEELLRNVQTSKRVTPRE